MTLKLVEIIHQSDAFTQIKQLIQPDLDQYVSDLPTSMEKEYVLDGYDRNIILTLDTRQGKQSKMNLRMK